MKSVTVNQWSLIVIHCLLSGRHGPFHDVVAENELSIIVIDC